MRVQAVVPFLGYRAGNIGPYAGASTPNLIPNAQPDTAYVDQLTPGLSSDLDLWVISFDINFQFSTTVTPIAVTSCRFRVNGQPIAEDSRPDYSSNAAGTVFRLKGIATLPKEFDITPQDTVGFEMTVQAGTAPGNYYLSILGPQAGSFQTQILLIGN